MAPDCLFCRDEIIQPNLIGQTRLFFIIADGSPVAPGHLLLIPQRHIATSFELNANEYADLQEAVNFAHQHHHGPKIKQIYARALLNPNAHHKNKQFLERALANWDAPITGFNLGVNCGQSAGQTVFHLHVHFIPRFDGDTPNPIGGVRLAIAPV